MSRIGRRFLAVFGLLTGLAASLLLLQALGQWLLPGWFGPLPGWLPEDTLFGIGYRLLADLSDWLAGLALSAVVLTFSYWLKPEDLPRSQTSALVRLSVLAIVVAVGFAMAQLLAQPWLQARLDDLTFRHREAQQLEDAYLAIKERGSLQTASDLQARFSLLNRLGLLRPTQSQRAAKERIDYDFELQILKAHFDLDEFFRLRALPGVSTAAEDTTMTVSDLLDQAEAALAEAGDREFQANLWGYQAFRRLMNAADQGKATDARALARAKAVVDASWSRIYEKTLAANERLKASYFFRKGKSLGDFQFQNYLEAYYGFQELARENPSDQEVAQHLALAKEKIADHVLFQQDMEVLFAVPGSENLVFVNRESPSEVVRIGRLLNTSQGVFVKDFEFLRFDAQGRTLLHWTAPFGRWEPQGIDFRVWDKDKPESRFPVVLTETTNNEFNPENDAEPPRFIPRVTVRDLEVVNADQPRPQTLGTWDLLVHGRAIESLGYNSRLFQTEFVVRLAEPFGFFVAFLLVFSLAWRNRAHDPGRTWWFLIPVLPLVAEFVVQTTAWASRLAVGGLLASLGLETAALGLSVGLVAAAVIAVVLAHRGLERSF